MQISEYTPPTILNNLEKWAVFFIYLFVNGLFIVKYGGRFSFYIFPVYLVSLLVFAVFYFKINLRNSAYQYLFWGLVALFFIFSVAVNYYVDGKSLNVDRWDAMEIGIKAIFNNEYPYNIRNYLGRESSNLPFLIVLGMPFYVVFGSVGFLQSFSFLLFSYLIFKIFKTYKLCLAAIVLFILSPSYLWEVYTKSDLFSNFILVTGFSYLVWTKLFVQNKLKIEWLSVMTALVFLTRLSVIIPLIILLTKAFYKFSSQEKLRFISVFVVVVFAMLFLFFRNAADWEMILSHNPLTIQGSKQPIFLSVSYLVLAIILAFKVKSYANSVFFSGFVLFIAIVIPYFLHLVEYGYQNVMVNSYFDLSFFNMSMPFIILSLVFNFNTNFKSNLK